MGMNAAFTGNDSGIARSQVASENGLPLQLHLSLRLALAYFD